MKKWWMAGAAVGVTALVLGVLLPLTRPGTAARAADGADEKKAERRITTMGSATVKVKPDGVHCSFGVKTTKAGTFKSVLEENEARVKKITEALNGLKITGLVVRVAPMDVQVLSDQNNFAFPGGPVGPGGLPPGGPMPPGPGGLPPMPPGGPPAKPGETATYTVVHSFTVTAKDKDIEKLTQLADKVLSTAVANGANTAAVFPNNPYNGFGGQGSSPSSGTKVEFFREDDTDLRRQALTQAVTAALANAKAVAGAANLTVRDIVTLTDQPANGQFYGFGGGSMYRSDIAGEYEITLSVSVTYAY